MARIHGRGGSLYMSHTSGGTAQPVAYLDSWSIEFSTDKAEVSALGDTNKVYVAGLPDCSGSFSGFFDDATAQSYTAATDGVARAMYLYPNRSGTPTQYFFGTGLPDFKVSGGVGDAVKINGDWAAASGWAKVG